MKMKIKKNKKIVKRKFRFKFILKNKLKQKFKNKLMPICFAILMIIATTINSFQNYCKATNNKLYEAISAVLNQNVIVQINDPKTNNELNVEVDWNEYMLGTMAGEATPGSSEQTLKSQALTIKNYALYHLVNNYLNNTRKPINTTDKFQVYLNKEQREKKFGKQLEKYEEIYKKAIEDTKNLVITYTYANAQSKNNNNVNDNNQRNEKLANTVYFASAGDKTEDAQNIWGTEVPYLKSVDNSFENADKKNIEIKLDEAFNLINSKIQSKKPTETNKPAEAAKPNDANKPAEAAKPNDANKPAEAAKPNDANKPAEAAKPNDANKPAEAAKPVLLNGESIKIESLNSSGRVQTVTALGVKFSGNEFRQTFKLPSTEFNLYFDQNKNTIIFECRGSGHGVGMSQNGADRLAKTRNYSFEQIIRYYYPGVEIKNIEDLRTNELT